MTGPVSRPRRRALAACGIATSVLGLSLLVASPAGAAEAPIGLGTATSYAVLAGSAVTNTGPSVITGDVGVSPLSSVGDFPPGIIYGTVHAADAEALQAKADLTLAFDDAAGRGPATAVATELGGETFAPGIYSGATLGLTGTVILDAGNVDDAVFVFKASSTLITGTGSAVELRNGADPCNVYWQVGSSATLGTDSVFVGTVMAEASITLDTRAAVTGRVLARSAAVTLQSNTITRPLCDVLPAGSTTTTAPASTSTSTGPTTSAPTTTVEGPTTTVVGPTTTVEGPTTTVEGPTTTVEGPTTTVEGPTTTEAPTTTVEAPTTTVQGPTTTVEAPTTTVQGPTTTVEAPTTTAPSPTTFEETTAPLLDETTVPGPVSTTTPDGTSAGIPGPDDGSSTGGSGGNGGSGGGSGRFDGPGGPGITTSTTLARTGSSLATTTVIGAATLALGVALVVASLRLRAVERLDPVAIATIPSWPSFGR